MNKKNAKMNTKRILVSFLLIASVLFLAGMVSAYNTPVVVSSPIASIDNIKVNGIDLITPGINNVGVAVGDTVTVQVTFTTVNGTAGDAQDVRIKATPESETDAEAKTPFFDVEGSSTADDNQYVKILSFKVPADFNDADLSDKFPLEIKIWNSDFSVEINGINLNVQRPSYDVAIKSVMTSSTVEAGQLFPVDIVLKNIGYNELEDLYVTAKIAGLNLEKKAYFGDLVNVAEDGTNDDEDTVSGRLYLEIPYNVKSGTYTLEVTAENEETSSAMTKEIAVTNGFPDLAMKSGNDLVLLNPTNQLKVYTVKYAETQVSVIVPAASSKSVTIQTPTSGEYEFDVGVFSGEQLLSVVKFSGTGSAPTSITSPVMVLTIILAVVFLVLLVVLVVLITKKPQKTEEFGESYY